MCIRDRLCTCHHEYLTTTEEEEHTDTEHTTFFLQYLLTTDTYIDDPPTAYSFQIYADQSTAGRRTAAKVRYAP